MVVLGGGAVSYERGTPVVNHDSACSVLSGATVVVWCAEVVWREFIDYQTSMITDEDPLRGLLFY